MRRLFVPLVVLALLAGLVACATASPAMPEDGSAGAVPTGAPVALAGNVAESTGVNGFDPMRAVRLTLAPRAGAGRGDLLPVGGDGGEPYRTGPSPDSPEVIPPPPLRYGTGALYAVGDSVLLGAEPYLRSTLGGWDARIDGRVSRTVPEGFRLVRMNRERIGDVLVVVLGHNYGGPGFTGWLDGLLDELSDVQRVVLVTVAEWSAAQREVNAAIRRAPDRRPNVVVADWAAVVAANPGFLRDHVHPGRAGATALANLIAVMVGPAPSPDGSYVARPHLLTIPAIDGGGSSTTSSGSSTWSGSSTTSTTTWVGSTTTTSQVVLEESTATTTTTTVESTTTTTTAGTSTTSTPTTVVVEPEEGDGGDDGTT